MSAETSQHVPKGFILDLNPQWVDTNAEVPDILTQGTSLFDQPPLYNVLTSRDIFPKGMFANNEDFGKVLLLNMYMRDWHESDHVLVSNLSGGMRRDDRLELLHTCLPKGTKTEQLAHDVCEQLSQYFASYPHIRRYFIEQTKLRRFDTWGQPYQTDALTENYSYSGWMKLHTWLADEAWKTDVTVGVSDEVKGFSTPADIEAALPPKRKRNRGRRFTSSGASN